MRKNMKLFVCLFLVAAFITSNIPIMAIPVMAVSGEEAQVTPWSLRNESADVLSKYDEQYRVLPVSWKNNGGQYSKPIDAAFDTDLTSFWEPRTPNNGSFYNYAEVDFGEVKEISRVIYGSRLDASYKGFANRFEIQISQTETGEDFITAVTGGHATTGELVEITFQPLQCRRLRFVWIECSTTNGSTGFASARHIAFYTEDTLAERIMDLFTDNTCSQLKPNVSDEMISSLQTEVDNYPVPGAIQTYLDIAKSLLTGESITNGFHEPIQLSQRGNRSSEYNRTGLTYTLSTFDLTGYYVLPGEQIQVFVDADPNGVMPRIVLAAVARNNSWAFGYDGQELTPGYNLIQVPKDLITPQVIYFCNPALPDQQAYAPTVRFSGGHKYPVYFYDGDDTYEEGKAKEAAFIQELNEYVTGVTDNYEDAAKGNGNYNICEFYSDKVIISVSARGAQAGLTTSRTWNKGEWRDWVDKAKYGVVQYDSANEPTGIYFEGPAATMEAYEWMYDDYQLYTGFNITDPTHEDYMTPNQFLFRAYNDGAGAGWGQNVFSGYNMGSQPNGSRWDSGFYAELATPGPALDGNWTVYHEIAHLFDSRLIGVPESTNNLYGLMAQLKYMGTNRLANEGENRWYKHFTNYINTGILPDNDMLFFPGAVIYQLDAVDFSKTRIYNAPEDSLLSNYGHACRYSRLHWDEIKNFDKVNRMVISFSMALGVDLSKHFEYYSQKIDPQVKYLLSSLPQEDRPTWLVNDRTFAGGAFSVEDAAKTPVIQSIVSNEMTGAVTLTIQNGTFDEQNLQCFAIYRRSAGTSDEFEWIGVTGDDKTTKNVNELYIFTDSDVIPGQSYEYQVGAYDCTLQETALKASSNQIAVGANANIPIQRLIINTGDEGKTMNVGNTYAVQAVLSPSNASVDFNTAIWTVEGYGRDSNGAGPDSILLTEDPNYPGDPTRRLVTGIQNGQTHVKLSLGGKTVQHRIVINGHMNVSDSKYKFDFSTDTIYLCQGDTVTLDLFRTDTTLNQTIRVASMPNNTAWQSGASTVATVEKGVVKALSPGESEISFLYNGKPLATCKVIVQGNEVPITAIKVSGSTSMKVGDSSKLSYTVEPLNSTNHSAVVWSSSKPGIVSVNQKGEIMALSPGEAVIKATIDGINGELKVIVGEYTPLKYISLDHASVILTEDNPSISLHLNKFPANASTGTPIWESSNSSVIAVDSSGVVTALSGGEAIITVSLDGKRISCKVSSQIGVPLNNIIIDRANLNLKLGDTYQLTAYPEPLGANNLSKPVWESDNTSVVTVYNGYLKAVGVGSATISVSTTQNGSVTKTASCIVTVSANTIPLTGISISRSSASVVEGKTLLLSTSNRPINANDAPGGLSTTEWKSTNTAVAQVDSNGLVSGLNPGETTIIAKRGGMSVSCYLVVKEDPSTPAEVGGQPNDSEQQEDTKPPVDQTDNQTGNQTNNQTDNQTDNQTTNQEAEQRDGEKKLPEESVILPPKNVKIGAITETSAYLSWDKSDGASYYRIYDQSSMLVQTADLSVLLTGLTPGKGYNLQVKSVLLDGIESEGTPIKFTTKQWSDTHSGGFISSDSSNYGLEKAPKEDKGTEKMLDDITFKDVSSDAWYYDAVQYVAKMNLMVGMDDEKFQPDEKMSRAMMVQVMYNMANKPTVVGHETSFHDVNPDDWFFEAVNWAKNNEVITGYGDGSFGPHDNVTREQLVTLLYRMANVRGYIKDNNVDLKLKNFSDASNISTYAHKAMYWAIEMGLIQGNGNGTVTPKSDATRCQLAAIIMRFCKTYPNMFN